MPFPVVYEMTLLGRVLVSETPSLTLCTECANGSRIPDSDSSSALDRMSLAYGTFENSNRQVRQYIRSRGFGDLIRPYRPAVLSQKSGAVLHPEASTVTHTNRTCNLMHRVRKLL